MDWRAMAALAVVVALAGCLADPESSAEDREDVVQALVLTDPVEVVGEMAREPAIVQARDGTLFVAGFDNRPLTVLDVPLGRMVASPLLWKSTDQGAHWNRVSVGDVPDGATGNSDVDLAVAEDGMLYFATLSFSNVGFAVAVGSSPDGGGTWQWSVLDSRPFLDRPWLGIAPDGKVHVAWNDGVHVLHASSPDGGRSWSAMTPVNRGGTGMLAVSPEGTLAIRIIPASGSGYTHWEWEDGVAVSTDDGLTWSFRDVPGERRYGSTISDPDATPRWADPLVFDVNGTLYTAWAEQDTMYLAHSRDLGDHWEIAALDTQEGDPYYPHLRAGDSPGKLALSWYSSSSGALSAHVAVVTQSDTARPVVRAGTFDPPSGTNSAGEYFQVTFLDEGGIGFANTLLGEEVGFTYRRAA